MKKVNLGDIMESFRKELKKIKTTENIEELFKTPEQLISKAPLNQLRKRRTKLFANALLLKAQEYLERHAIRKAHSSMMRAMNSDLKDIEDALSTLCTSLEMIQKFFRQILTLSRSTKASTECPGSDYYSLHIRRTAAALLTVSKSPSLDDALHAYYSWKMDEMMNSMEASPRSRSLSSSTSRYESTSHTLGATLTPALNYLLLNTHNEEALNSVVFGNFSKYLSELSERSNESDHWSRVLPTGQKYLTTVILSFLEMYGDQRQLPKWKSRLFIYLHQFIGELRISQLFDISVDHPSSIPAMEDVKDCLQANESSLHSIFVKEFSKQIKRRLLQAGASTRNIIDHFMNTAKMLSKLDPSGVLMEGMTQSYKDYLVDRPDTMKCIVSVLTDTKKEEDSVLEKFSDEMQIADAQDEDIDRVCLEEIQRFLQNGAEADNQKRRSAVGDLISTFVGIYSTKECFLAEYQKMLAEQLMLKSDYCCEREYRVLELLKKRFGEGPLHHCEVMLHDVMESNRLNKNLQEETRNTLMQEARQNVDNEPIVDLSACMVSHMFWPESKEPQIVLPPNVQRALEVYGAEFHNRRSPRKLEWRTGAGIVQLEVSIGNEKREYKVSPVHASILLLFKTTDKLTEQEMAESLGISIPILKSRISFWIKNGVLYESHDQDTVSYGRRTQMERPDTVVHDDTDDDLQDNEDSEDGSFKELQYFKPYILGYLQGRSQGASLDQIHRHLVRFIVQPVFEMNESQLSRCLNRLIEKAEIKLENGTYLLP